jgi:hypothetical protein
MASHRGQHRSAQVVRRPHLRIDDDPYPRARVAPICVHEAGVDRLKIEVEIDRLRLEVSLGLLAHEAICGEAYARSPGVNASSSGVPTGDSAIARNLTDPDRGALLASVATECHDPRMTGSLESPASVAAAYFDAWKSNDIERVRPLLHKDVDFVGALGTTDGLDGSFPRAPRGAGRSCFKGGQRLRALTS